QRHPASAQATVRVLPGDLEFCLKSRSCQGPECATRRRTAVGWAEGTCGVVLQGARVSNSGVPLPGTTGPVGDQASRETVPLSLLVSPNGPVGLDTEAARSAPANSTK